MIKLLKSIKDLFMLVLFLIKSLPMMILRMLQGEQVELRLMKIPDDVLINEDGTRNEDAIAQFIQDNFDEK